MTQHILKLPIVFILFIFNGIILPDFCAFATPWLMTDNFKIQLKDIFGNCCSWKEIGMFICIYFKNYQVK